MVTTFRERRALGLAPFLEVKQSRASFRPARRWLLLGLPWWSFLLCSGLSPSHYRFSVLSRCCCTCALLPRHRVLGSWSGFSGGVAYQAPVKDEYHILEMDFLRPFKWYLHLAFPEFCF